MKAEEPTVQEAWRGPCPSCLVEAGTQLSPAALGPGNLHTEEQAGRVGVLQGEVGTGQSRVATPVLRTQGQAGLQSALPASREKPEPGIYYEMPSHPKMHDRFLRRCP